MSDAKKKSILFLCTGNSCRSQMAEGWARHLQGDKFEVFSAGVETHGMNPLALKVMAEAGIDISGHHSKLLGALRGRDFDYVITVCDNAAESCPVFHGKAKIIHRSFPDPPKLAAHASDEEEALVFYRQVRDEIKEFVDSLPDSLKKA